MTDTTIALSNKLVRKLKILKAIKNVTYDELITEKFKQDFDELPDAFMKGIMPENDKETETLREVEPQFMGGE